MGVIARRRIKEDLHKVEVFLTDTTNEYFAVQDIPDTFVQGRSSFKIFGSQFLKHGIPLKIEILDRAGKTVYIQPVKYGQGLSPQLQFTYISVEVYRHNASGEAQLTILGSLDETKVPFNIPERFRGAYNVKWQKTINLNKAAIKNTQPILFYKSPSVTTQEVVKAEKKADPPSNKYIRGKQIYGKVKVDLLGQRFNTGSDVNTQTGESGGDDGTGGASDKSETSMADVLAELNLWKYKTGEYGKNSLLAKKGIVEEQVFSEPPQMTIYSNKPDAFNTKMVGGTVNVRNIQLTDGQKQTLSGLSPSDVAIAITQDEINERFSQVGDSESIPDFTARIENVISDTELTVTKPYSVDFRTLGSDKSIKIYSDIGLQYYTNPNDASSGVYADFTASYVDWSVPTTSSYRFFSYIDMKVRNMRTFSGDVYRLKIYGASDGNQGDFPVLLDTIVESPELLVDTGSASGVLRSGYLQNLGHINKYWNSYGGDGTDAKLNPAFTMSLADGAYLSGSYSDYNESGRFETKKAYAFTIKKDIPYTLSFKAIGKKTTKTTVNGDSYKDAKLYVHISGSNLSDDSGLTIPISSSFGHPVTNELNKPVGLQVVSGSNTPDTQKWGPVSYTFTPKFKLDRVKNEDTVLQFRIESGNWSISDISLKPGMDTGFSPDEMEIRLPIPWPTKRPDNFDFLIEYYDVDGRMAEPYTFINNVQVSGSELVMEGTDNLLTGSLYVGNIQGAGIEFAGKNSAYMRSIGYEGFISASAGEGGGFMIWSGSVLPDSPDNYSGSGLEIHDGRTGDDESYFKFRTIDADVGGASSFDVKTSRFFFGKAGQFISGANGNITISSSAFFLGDRATAFVSGANGNLEISSSNFHVSGGVISASAGHLGNWSIEDGTLKGENITMDAANSTIYKTDQGPGSDSGAAFDRLRDEYYIDFSPEVENPDNFYIKMGPMFMVDKDGILVASGAVFHGSITASAGYIGGFQIGSASIYSTQGGGTTATPDFFISGSARPQVLPFDKGNLFISASGFQVTSRGAISASDGNIGGWTLGKNRLLSPNNRLTMSALPGAEYFGVTNAAGQERVRIGEISAAASDKYGIKIFDGTAGDNDDGDGQIVLLGDLGNKIGGWEITNNQIRSIPNAGLGGAYAEAERGLVIHSRGTLETSDFASGLKGWRISSLGNGTAEFENCRIRGTLRTTVFEKESVNVVGGQLMVANSTTMEPLRDVSGSIVVGVPSMSATDVTMSCANVSGFSPGEILKAKKVDDTGFSVEYLYLTGSLTYSHPSSSASASIAAADMGAVDPDGLAGELYVGRAYGATKATSSVVTTLDGAINDSVITVTVDSVSAFGSGSTARFPSIDTTYQEIIKIDTERMKVTSASIGEKELYVKRDYHGTTAAAHSDGVNVQLIDQDAEFLSGLVSTAQAYNEGQVFVSTGKFNAAEDISTGYILMNANPNDINTPYMDIVERTGSGVYDLQLRTRLGDLSGLSSGYLYGDEEPGFGLYTNNGYFRGTITAQTGSFLGAVWINTSATERMAMGRNVKDSNDGIFINAHNYWYTTGGWKVGGATNYLSLDSATAGNIDIKSATFALETSTLIISSSGDGGTGIIRLGASGGPASPTAATAGIYMDGGGALNVYGDAANYLRFDGSSVDILTDEITIQTGGTNKLKLFADGTNTPTFAMGATLNTDYDGGNAGVYMDGSGKFAVYGDASNYIRFNGSTVDIKSDELTIQTAGTNKLKLFSDGASTPTFAMGATLNTGISGTNKGIYMDGVGNFLLYASATNYFKFDASAAAIDIKSDTFDLDATTIMLDSAANSGTIMVGSTTAQRVVMSGSAGTLAFYDDDGVRRLRMDTRREISTFTEADGTTSSSIHPIALVTADQGRFEAHGSVFNTWNDTYTSSSLEGGRLRMSAQQSAGLGIGRVAEILAKFDISGSQLNYGGSGDGAITAVSASSRNSGFGQAHGFSAGPITSTLAAIGLYLHDIDSSITIPAAIYAERIGTAPYGTGAGDFIRTANNAGGIKAQTGSAADPTYSYGSDRDTGLFAVDTSGNIGVALGGTEEFRFASSGHFHADNDITAYSSTVASDIRLKENIKPLENNLDKILELKPSLFTWKVRDKQDDVGLIAQEVESVIPMIVKETISIGYTKEFLDGDTHKTVDYAKLTTYLIGAVQEQQKQIDELKQKLEEL